ILTLKPSQVLDYLIQNQKKKTTRQDIIDNVWRNKGCTDENFHKTLGVLRKELGDKNKPWKYIINPRKNHYALLPKVKFHYVFSRADIYRFIKKSSVVLVSSLLVTTAAIKTQTLDKVSGYLAVDSQTVTHLKGQVKRASASIEQSVLVFMHKPVNWSGWDLRVQRLGTEESKLLVKSTGALFYNAEPSFSPSGQQLAWVKTDYNQYCEVWVADFNSTELSISNERSVLSCAHQYWARTPQWRTDESLLISLPQGNHRPNNIQEINLISNERFSITSPTNSRYGDYGLYYNAEVNLMAYLRLTTGGDIRGELRIFDFSTNSDFLLKGFRNAPYAAAWLNTSSLLVKGESGFEVVNIDGETLPVISNMLEPQSFPFSMGSNRVGFVRGELKDNDIIIFDLTSGSISNNLSSTAHDYRAVISKDSDQIAFLSLRNGRRQLLMTSNNLPTKVVEFNEHDSISELAISPDGKTLAFVKGNQLNLISARGQVEFQKNIAVGGISFSYDNTALFIGVKEAELLKIKKLGLSGTVETITEGFMPKSAEDGYLYFFKLEGDKPYFYRISPEGGIKELFEAPFPVLSLNSNSFDVINNHLYYVDGKGKDKMLVSKDLSSGEVKTVAPVTSRTFSLNQKLTKLVMTKKGQVQNNLAAFTLVKN
ncbi:PD40 domain-containing protein, partial [Aliikangiella coralliicola]